MHSWLYVYLIIKINPIYQTQYTKLNLLKQIFSLGTKPNLLNQITYRTKYTKPNVPNQIYSICLANLICLTNSTKLNLKKLNPSLYCPTLFHFLWNFSFHRLPLVDLLIYFFLNRFVNIIQHNIALFIFFIHVSRRKLNGGVGCHWWIAGLIM